MIVQALSGGVVGYAFWRIEFDHSTFPFNNLATSIEMYSEIGGENLAIQGVTGTGGGNGTGDNAGFDQDPLTYIEWVWPNADPDVFFHFDSDQNIVSFSWTFMAYPTAGSPSNGPFEFRLFYSPDGIVPYTLVDSWPTNILWADGETRTFNV